MEENIKPKDSRGDKVILPHPNGEGALEIPVPDSNLVSDSYHTFGELYNHRLGLFAALMMTNPEISWISKRHHDGSSYPGWFIGGMNLPTGQITYHLPLPFFEHLVRTKISILGEAPEYDGHTPDDVLIRLANWVDPPKNDEKS